MKAKIYEYQDNGVTNFKGNAIYGGSGWELEVELPDFLNPYETVCGEIAIDPENSYPQSLTDCLHVGRYGNPCLCVAYGRWGLPAFKYYGLKVVSRKETDLALYI